MFFLQNVPTAQNHLQIEITTGAKNSVYECRAKKKNHDSAKLVHNNRPLSPSYFIYLPQLIFKYFLSSLGSW